MNIRRKPDHPTLKICFWNGGSGSFSLSAVPFRGNKLPLDIGALESSHWSRRERHKTEPHRVPFCNVFSRPLLLLTPTVYPFVIPPQKKGFFYISLRDGEDVEGGMHFSTRDGCAGLFVLWGHFKLSIRFLLKKPCLVAFIGRGGSAIDPFHFMKNVWNKILWQGSCESHQELDFLKVEMVPLVEEDMRVSLGFKILKNREVFSTLVLLLAYQDH